MLGGGDGHESDGLLWSCAGGRALLRWKPHDRRSHGQSDPKIPQGHQRSKSLTHILNIIVSGFRVSVGLLIKILECKISLRHNKSNNNNNKI